MKQMVSRVFCVVIMTAPLFVWAQTVPEAMVGEWRWEKKTREGEESETFIVKADGTFELRREGMWYGGVAFSHTYMGTAAVSSNQITLTVTHDMEYRSHDMRLLNRRESEEVSSTIRYRLSGNTLTLGNRPYKRQ